MQIEIRTSIKLQKIFGELRNEMLFCDSVGIKTSHKLWYFDH